MEDLEKIKVETNPKLNNDFTSMCKSYRKGGPFGVFLPLKTVGIMGDYRTYEYICSIRIVESTDAMTANFSRLD